MQKWLDDNEILMNLIHNECKSVVAERFMKLQRVKYIKNDS